MNNLKSYYLLVKFEEYNEDLIQEILEVALVYAVLPYSSGDECSLIFESSSESILAQFRKRLLYEDFPVSIETILR